MGLAALLSVLAWPPSAVRGQDEWIVVETPHFHVEAISAHTPQASWYAAFVEQVHTELADILLTSLDRRVRVRLYPTEEAYVAANPIAVRSHGILAHARPSGDEIGMALVRLEALPGPARVAAFRHELAHLLLNQRSGGRLPIGFHEGIAQYVEQDPTTVADSQEGLRRAHAAGALLNLIELNRPSVFMARPEIGYPQSYALVAFLAERHGLGKLTAMLDALRDGHDPGRAVQSAFGVSWDELERDWREAVPGMVMDGIPRNTLPDGSLRSAQQAAADQRWSEAAGLARRAEQFWLNLGNSKRRAESLTLAERAESIESFQRTILDARRQLDESRFDLATTTLEDGLRRLTPTADPELRPQLDLLLERARAGQVGLLSLEAAETALAEYRVIDAQRLAGEALQQLTLAGSTEDAAVAREVQLRAQQLQYLGGSVALATALLCGSVLLLARNRNRPTPPHAPRQQEIRL